MDLVHTGRNCFNLFQISFSANTTVTDPEVSEVSKDQKNCHGVVPYVYIKPYHMKNLNTCTWHHSSESTFEINFQKG